MQLGSLRQRQEVDAAGSEILTDASWLDGVAL
jgi:hypothetical protein